MFIPGMKDEMEKTLDDTMNEQKSRDSYRGGETWDIPPKSISPQKIHSVLTLFGIITTKYVYFTTIFLFKMSSISLKSIIKCSKFESERQLRRRVFMSFI